MWRPSTRTVGEPGNDRVAAVWQMGYDRSIDVECGNRLLGPERLLPGHHGRLGDAGPSEDDRERA